MTEDYCDFETAKLLKEKGFDCPCNAYYDCFSTDNFHNGCEPTDFNSIEPRIRDIVSSPSLGLVMKWLGEVHGLHISLEPCYDYDSMHVVFLAFVQNVADVHEFMDGRKNVASYPNAEKSYELAIKYCLENLI